MQSLIELSGVLLKFVSETLSASALKGRAVLFLELPLQSLPQTNYQGNKMFKGIAQNVVKFISETLSWYLF